MSSEIPTTGPDGRPLTAKQKRQLKAKLRRGGGHHRTEENTMSRHYGGKYERERRKGKQPTCRVCGGPHERRQCPGIEDDGTGMSWYKGKSDKSKTRGRTAHGRAVDQSGQWAGWKRRQGKGQGGRVDPAKFLRRFAKLDPPEAGGAAVVDGCCDLTAVFDAISLAAVSGGRASDDEYSVALEEVCPLQPTFAGCVVKLGSALDWSRRFYLRRSQASRHKKKKGKKKTTAEEAAQSVDPAASEPAIQENLHSAEASAPTGVQSGSTPQRRPLPCCCGVSPTATELIACNAWSEAATEEFLAGLPTRLTAALNADDVVACCCGLDYSTDCPTPRSIQKRLAAAQIETAVRAGKPVLVTLHPELRQTEAYDEARLDLLAVLQASMPPEHPFVLCAWAGDAETAVKLCGFFPQCYVGLSGVATFSKAAHMRELCFDVPLDRLLLTTDAPHSPASEVGAAGVPALPSHTPFIAAAVASQKRTTVAAVLNAAAENSRRFFGVDFAIAPSFKAKKQLKGSKETLREAGSAKEQPQDPLKAGSTAAAGPSCGEAMSTTAGQSGGNVGVVQSKRFKCTRCKKKCKFAAAGFDNGKVPGPCQYCGANFCARHRIPEVHQCEAIPENNSDGEEEVGDSSSNDDSDESSVDKNASQSEDGRESD